MEGKNIHTRGLHTGGAHQVIKGSKENHSRGGGGDHPDYRHLYCTHQCCRASDWCSYLWNLKADGNKDQSLQKLTDYCVKTMTCDICRASHNFRKHKAVQIGLLPQHHLPNRITHHIKLHKMYYNCLIHSAWLTRASGATTENNAG